MSNLKDKDGRVKVLIALLSVYFIWGSTYLAIRIALEGFPPFMMAGLRFLVTGGGLLSPVMRKCTKDGHEKCTTI